MSCSHLDAHRQPATAPVSGAADGCPDCVAAGEAHWVHLRVCLSCGYVGCCDSSPLRHASAHYARTLAAGDPHPVIRSFEPGETWRWCYVDELVG